MAQNKTQPTKRSVRDFIAKIEPERRRAEAAILLDLMHRATGMEPALWGENMIGYGTYHYHYKSGRQGDYFLTGFSMRKTAISIYIMPGFKAYSDLLEKLGKHKHSVSCLYVTRLENIEIDVLETLVSQSVEDMKQIYPDWSADAFRTS